MRIVGIEQNKAIWIARELAGGYAAIAPIEEFYADLDRHLERARDLTSADIDGPQAIAVPVGAKILCCGLNYVDHAAESEKALPKVPDVFGRWQSTLVPTGAIVPLPFGEPGLDWEGELAAVIARPLRNATPQEVEDAVLGYTILNDLSARYHQRATSQWTIGKNADRSAPFGPAIVTRDEIADPYALRLETRVEGKTMQSEITGEMLFRIGVIGAYASQTMTLRPGDVISTGTPAGIGSKRQPPIFLTAGQTVEVEIERIGILTTRIATEVSVS